MAGVVHGAPCALTSRQYERTRSRGTRLLRVATHFPCIVLCLVRDARPSSARTDRETG